MSTFATIITVSTVSVLAALALLIAIVFRRVVPTDMVHIVQAAKRTTSYGKGKDAGNVYYAWPAWVPRFGVLVRTFPESIFAVPLRGYAAYDANRIPFAVDVMAFFRVEDSSIVAQRVSSFDELKSHLISVLEGAVRRILATNELEKLMEMRGELGEQFTGEVDAQSRNEWGVRVVKTIEFMDIRDSDGSNVIEDIMAKHQARINRESRTVVADHTRAAEIAEIEAKREVDLTNQAAMEQVGIRTADQEKQVGISREHSKQEIAAAAATTAERNMAVQRVNDTRAAEIARDVALTAADADKQSTIIKSEGVLTETRNAAEGTMATGTANAKAEELILLAPVTAQITLAKEIGGNDGYQSYLVKLRQLDAAQEVGKSMADALEKADLKIISTSGGGNIAGDAATLVDMFSPAGGTKLAGMFAALAATEEGKAIIAKLTT